VASTVLNPMDKIPSTHYYTGIYGWWHQMIGFLIY